MGKYAAQEDVLRVLGGTETAVQRNFSRLLWTGPVTSVTVDGLAFDVPDSILVRINTQITSAESKVDGYLQARYQEPVSVVPDSLRTTTAQLAAFHAPIGVDTRTEYLRDLHKEAMQWCKDLASGKVDLGIQDPRPAHIAPFANVVKGLGSWRGCY